MIKSCRKLKLRVFNEISDNIENVYLLIEKGDKPKESELIDAWLGIIDEYNGLVKTKNYSLNLKKRAEIEGLKLTIKNLINLKLLLSIEKYEAKESLLRLCKKLSVSPNDKSIHIKIKGLEVKLKLKLNAFSKSVSDTSFEELKESIERFRNIYIDVEKVTVSEFASYIAAINKQNENQKKVSNGRSIPSKRH